MSLTILQSQVKSQRVVLVDPGYPYGKKPYMGGSVVAVAAQLMAARHAVDFVDFNIDKISDERVCQLFAEADTIGISVMGSPGIPGAIQFANRMVKEYPHTKIVLGGQVVSHFSRQQFSQVFGPNVMQMAKEEDLVKMFGSLQDAYEVSFQSAWERMGDQRLRDYLSHEFALVLSQGGFTNALFVCAKGPNTYFPQSCCFP